MVNEVRNVQKTERDVPSWMVASRTVPSAASPMMVNESGAQERA